MRLGGADVSSAVPGRLQLARLLEDDAERRYNPKLVDREREEGGVSFRVINVRRRLAGR